LETETTNNKKSGRRRRKKEKKRAGDFKLAFLLLLPRSQSVLSERKRDRERERDRERGEERERGYRCRCSAARRSLGRQSNPMTAG
jgi:hypothetical protein